MIDVGKQTKKKKKNPANVFLDKINAASGDEVPFNEIR